MMDDKTCLVTGASDGIGYATSLELARKGAQVMMVGRDAAKTEAAAHRISAETGNAAVTWFLADLSSLAEVRALADRVKEQAPRLDVLLNNAGAIFLSGQPSADGIEMTFALNHLGHFLLTNLLLDLIKTSAPARIINVSSSSHRSVSELRLVELLDPARGRGYRAYGRSKLCNILFTYELARRLEGTGVTVNALHPGLVQTNIARNNGIKGRLVNFFIGVRGMDAGRGAETPLYLASSPEVEEISGKYFENCQPVPSSPLSYDPLLARRLWDMSERLTGVGRP